MTSVLSDRDRFVAVLATRRRKVASGCWEWTGYVHTTGYGYYRTATSNIPAHRIAYEVYVGPIPDGAHLHHTCENKTCVNPAHLTPVSTSEHMAIHRATETCPKCGGTNRRTTMYRGKPNGRQCNDCSAAYKRARRARERAARHGCPYCGGPTDGAAACEAHIDLLNLDPAYAAVVTETTTGPGRTSFDGTSAAGARRRTS